MNYTIKKPTVGDMRQIYQETTSQNDISFLLAERCILLNGVPIGKTKLDQLPLDEFEKLIAEIMPEKKS